MWPGDYGKKANATHAVCQYVKCDVYDVTCTRMHRIRIMSAYMPTSHASRMASEDSHALQPLPMRLASHAKKCGIMRDFMRKHKTPANGMIICDACECTQYARIVTAFACVLACMFACGDRTIKCHIVRMQVHEPSSDAYISMIDEVHEHEFAICPLRMGDVGEGSRELLYCHVLLRRLVIRGPEPTGQA